MHQSCICVPTIGYHKHRVSTTVALNIQFLSLLKSLQHKSKSKLSDMQMEYLQSAIKSRKGSLEMGDLM